MLNKIWLLTILTIFSISLISSQLVISPQEVAVSQAVNEAKTFQLNLTNRFNFSIQDIRFSNLDGFNFGNIILQPNQTKQIDVTVSRSDPINTRIISTVSFNYLLPVPDSPQTFEVNISDSNGFSPQEITIHQGDSIIWKNKGSITHAVTSQTFDNQLPVGGTFQKTFDNIATIDYFDSIVFFTGRINVLNRSIQQPINNPSFNTNWFVNLSVIRNPTNLNLQIIEQNFSVKFGDFQEGSLKVTNTGNQDAFNIMLSSTNNWVEFDENNFSLSPTVSNFVTFKVAPFIQTSQQTNQTYNIIITSKGSNTDGISGNISVFVPFESLENLNDTNVNDFFKSKLVFCREFPTSGFCITEPIIEQRNITVIREPPVPYNFTHEEIATIFTKLQSVADNNLRTSNENKITSDYVKQNIGDIKDQINETEARSLKTEEAQKTTSNLTWIAATFAILFVCTVTIFYYVRRWNLTKTARSLYAQK